MYFGGRHELTVVETVDLPFKCGKCGVEKTARIAAAGHGEARSPFFIGNSRARSKAIENAFSDAHAMAGEALGMVACPVCGHRASSARSFSVLPLIAGAALCGVIGLFLGGGGSAIIGVGAGTIFGLLAVTARRRQTSSTADGVQWFDGEPPDKPVIGRKCKSCKKQIVLATDGMRCEQCGAALHTQKCAEKHARKAHGPPAAATPYRS